jgi:MerC mercury resistance protein
MYFLFPRHETKLLTMLLLRICIILITSWIFQEPSVYVVVHAWNPSLRLLSRNKPQQVLRQQLLQQQRHPFHYSMKQIFDTTSTCKQKSQRHRLSSIGSNSSLHKRSHKRRNDNTVHFMTTTTTSKELNDGSIDDTKRSNNNHSTQTKKRSWKEQLVQCSNMASILCVFDCTILPIVSFMFPLLGLFTLSSYQMNFIHSIGHQISLYFVIPIGMTASTMNYFYRHHNKWILTMAYIGVVLIGIANMGATTLESACSHHHHHMITNPSFRILQHVINMLQHGIGHRIMNLCGCSLLLFSNYISHQVSKSHHSIHIHGPECNNHHHH